MRLKQSYTLAAVLWLGSPIGALAQSAPPSTPAPSASPTPTPPGAPGWTDPSDSTAGEPKAGAKPVDPSKKISCQAAATKWFKQEVQPQVASPLQAGHFTAVMINEFGDPCYFFGDRDFAVAGDPIFAAVHLSANTAGASVGLANCAAESPVSLFASGDLFVPQAAKEAVPEWASAPRRVCHGSGTVEVVAARVTAEANGKLSEPSVKKTTLNQYARYRATLQLGVINSTRRDATFGLRKDGDVNRIYSQTPAERGPEYVGILNIYAFPRYFKGSPWGGLYKGRDIVHDHGVLDRLGLVAGAGLSKPSRRFMAGGSFELFPGMSALVVHEWTQVKQLAEVKEGATFSEAADKIPTRDEWTKGWVIGASFDLLYAAKLFGKKP
jgi:hypothetical protein